MPGFLLDLDGTLYHGDRPIPHAAEFIRWSRDRRFPFLFVTNNSSRTPGQVAEHLLRTGIEASAEEVLSSAQAAAMHLKSDRPDGGSVYCIGEEGLRLALEEAGFTLAAEAGDQGIAAVVQGIDRSFHYDKFAEGRAIHPSRCPVRADEPGSSAAVERRADARRRHYCRRH
ncbi:hypothetical protein LJK87_27305 [Paenibacillus sp. P25]|nr:hypothetical protein LJK87_27305 [Paenibacillus sp. P25]